MPPKMSGSPPNVKPRGGYTSPNTVMSSTKFRDGKPKDNQAKDVSGIGQAAVTKYRRHDLQKATVEGESA